MRLGTRKRNHNAQSPSQSLLRFFSRNKFVMKILFAMVVALNVSFSFLIGFTYSGDLNSGDLNSGDLMKHSKSKWQGHEHKEEEEEPKWDIIKLKFPSKLQMPSKEEFPSDFDIKKHYAKEGVLGGEFNISSLKKASDISFLHPQEGLQKYEVQYLGVLLDAGRHYFPVKWIKRMISVLSIMNFNYLHFRLTDDQTFNLQLNSQPLLAYPTTLNGNTKVYSPEDLRDIVKFAKSKGIDVIPEINVPGHGASWGGHPELIMQCSNFICNKGYGIPLNVAHPKFENILRDVLKEVIDIFDDPPYLHLGGDEVNMAKNCFKEVGMEMFDYNNFESTLKTILKEIKYDESNVIRWEMSHVIKDLDRAGKITHFWLRMPGSSDWNNNYPDFNGSMFLSTHLYFDTNNNDSAYEVYIKTKTLKHNAHKQSLVLGIVGGTFELSTDFWQDRNVIGRLLAISMGVSGLDITDRFQFLKHYREICRSSGFPDEMCNLYGVPPRDFKDFRNELKDGKSSIWSKWIDNTCDRLTESKKVYNKPTSRHKKLVSESKEDFRNTVNKESKWTILPPKKSKLGLVDHVGVIIDMTRHPLDETMITSILENTMVPLELNMIQLRMITDVSMAYFSKQNANVPYLSPFLKEQLGNNQAYPDIENLLQLKKESAKFAIAIMPEIAISTNAGGMYMSGFNMECPEFLCEYGKYIPQDINNKEYLAVLYSLVEELVKINSSPYIHLGYDERKMSTPCFLEASRNGAKPDFDKFEEEIEALLKLADVTSDSVIRWENQEETHYPSRFGDITQCVAGESCRLASTKNDAAKSPWFGTVNVLKGSAYEIYTQTRNLASQSPLGLMAEIGSMREDDNIYQTMRIDYRLLAFSMGTINTPMMSRDEFEALYVSMCLDITLFVPGKNGAESHESICKTFSELSHQDKEATTKAVIKREEYLAQGLKDAMCKERTRIMMGHQMKDPSKIMTAVSMKQ